MPKVWKDDFNTKIIGDKRHWTEHPPNSPHEIHHQWRISLNENLLINIFENPPLGPGDPDLPLGVPASFTFGAYYNMTVSLFLKTLISRLNYVPTYTPSDETRVPQQERSRLKARRVERVQRLLRGALARASANDAAALQMKDLYLAESYADVAKKDAIDDLCEQFWAAQQVVRWLCMPFLQYTDLGADPALTRPSIADLVRHLDGEAPPPPGTPPAPPTSIFGVRNLTYSEFAFLSTVSSPPQEDLKAKYLRTRDFAFNKGFFNKDNVVANYYKNLAKDIQSVLGAEGSAAISALSGNAILGGGNGYKCHVNAQGQKSCIPGDTRDYCANGGQTCTG